MFQKTATLRKLITYPRYLGCKAIRLGAYSSETRFSGTSGIRISSMRSIIAMAITASEN